jgi:hypothetical protein
MHLLVPKCDVHHARNLMHARLAQTGVARLLPFFPQQQQRAAAGKQDTEQLPSQALAA